MINKWFVVDAESDGIYGDILSIAAKVIDGEREVARFYAARKVAPEDIQEEWVRENVCPYLKNADTFFESEYDLLEAFYAFYLQYRDDYAVLTDVPYPVETGIFRKCIMQDPEHRKEASPYPVYDLMSMLQRDGLQNEDRMTLAQMNAAPHDAMNDVDAVIRIMRKLNPPPMPEEERSPLAYSYHTFYFPFVWNTDLKTPFSEFLRKMKKTASPWEDVSLIKDTPNTEQAQKIGISEKQLHQLLVYFTESTKKSIFGWDADFVRTYVYDPARIHNKACYRIIKKWKQKTNGKVQHNVWDYQLPLNAIHLRIYNTGIGILSIEAENHRHRSVDDVKRINEYGRRLFPPYEPGEWDLSEGDCNTGVPCADALWVQFADNEDDKSFYSELSLDEQIPSFIKDLLRPLPLIDVDTIRPAIDDRMMVGCLLNDEIYAYHMTRYDGLSAVIDWDEQHRLSPDDTNDGIYQKEKRARNEIVAVAKDLYELAYIDTPGGCSCQNNVMLRELLEGSVYKRWSDYGTLHLITHHSYVCVSSPDAFGAVGLPFLLQYTHLISIVLAQRATALVFDEISSTLHATKSSEVIALQKKYIAYCNQHNNIEVTCQEQGIEIYEMLQKAMYVDKDAERLEKEIELLYETANAASDKRLNILAFWLAIALIVLQPVADHLIGQLMTWLQNLFTPPPQPPLL